MKNFFLLLTLCVCILAAISSCSKSNVKPKNPTDTTETKTGTTTGTPGTTDVYVAGYELNSKNEEIPVYWKNGTEVKLPSGASTKCMAKAIFVSGNDVYVAGYTGSQACYWKNGVLVSLPSQLDTLQATSIHVNNGNVYVGITQSVMYEAQKRTLLNMLLLTQPAARRDTDLETFHRLRHPAFAFPVPMFTLQAVPPQ